ncbi:hypothetical protein F66182_3071 [Fusarium sp. NRRL 66182]|nr:hypothetical protein F66182_3071 [Fusarium sp. NRRL 66182]
MYTLRHEYWPIQAASTSALRVMFDHEHGPLQLDTFMRACQALKESGECCPIANGVLWSTDLVAKKSNIQFLVFAIEYLVAGLDNENKSIVQFTVSHSSMLEDSAAPGQRRTTHPTIAEIGADDQPETRLD